MSFCRTPRLPDGQSPIPIVRARPGQPLRLFPLSGLYGSCWTHWNGRTVWCEGKDSCLCDDPELQPCSRRWCGWLPCRLYECSRRVILALTPNCAITLWGWREAGKVLRGRYLDVKRADQRPNAPVALELSEQTFPSGRLPEPFDVTWSVLHCLGVSQTRMEALCNRGFTMMPQTEAEMEAELI